MKKKNKTKKMRNQEAQIFGGIALVAFVVATFFTIFGLSRTVIEMEEVAIEKTPEAILAKAGVEEGRSVALPVIYYDQRADECVNLYDVSLSDALYARQFEWTDCGYNNKQLEQGMVDYYLDDNYLPVAKGGNLTPNRGIKDMVRWFSTVEGKSFSYSGILEMNYRNAGAEFSFYHDNFYPLDEADFSKGDFTSKDGHNHLFTMSFAVPFTVLNSGSEDFMITADDDTFVYVGNELVIDMGGVHDAMTGRFRISKDGEIYAGVNGEELAYTGVNVEGGEGSIVRIFHADRDSSESVFNIVFTEMNLSVMNTTLAKQEGIQIAYDPTDPTYVAPLGESKVFKPDNTKSYIVLATIEGFLVVIFAILMSFAIKFMVERRIKK